MTYILLFILTFSNSIVSCYTNHNNEFSIIFDVYIILYIIDDSGNREVPKVTKHFSNGQFRCPVVWSTRFSLHPRLQHSISMLLLGTQVLHTVLDKFSVRNRRNMFVYKESTGSVFYLRYIFKNNCMYFMFLSMYIFSRLYENSSQQQQKNNLGDPFQYDSDDEDSISRCSSATSTTATVSSLVVPSNNSNFYRKYSEEFNVCKF